MNFQIPDFTPAVPEIFLLSMACLILVIDVFIKQENRFFTYLLCQFSLMVTARVTFYLFDVKETLMFSYIFVCDDLSSVL